MTKYEILQDTICDGWVNNWHEVYDTYEDAHADLLEFLAEADQDYFNGYIESRYHINEFKIVEVIYE